MEELHLLENRVAILAAMDRALADLRIGEIPPLEGEGIDTEVQAGIVFYETSNREAAFSADSMG